MCQLRFTLLCHPVVLQHRTSDIFLAACSAVNIKDKKSAAQEGVERESRKIVMHMMQRELLRGVWIDMCESIPLPVVHTYTRRRARRTPLTFTLRRALVIP